MDSELKAIATLEFAKATERIRQELQGKLGQLPHGWSRGGQIDPGRVRLELEAAENILHAYTDICLDLITKGGGQLTRQDVIDMENEVRQIAAARKTALTTGPRPAIGAAAVGEVSRRMDQIVASIKRDLEIQIRKQNLTAKQEAAKLAVPSFAPASVPSTTSKKDHIVRLIEEARNFTFCGPSDDPDEQTSVTTGYRYLVIQFQRLVGPILPEPKAAQLSRVRVDVNGIYSAMEAKAELDALLPDIEAALEHFDESRAVAAPVVWIVSPDLIEDLSNLKSTRFDLGFLVHLCREINSSRASGNILATVLLMRTVLNHVPPLFGKDTFEQVVAEAGKSLKESFDHLQHGLRKVADLHTHRKISPSPISSPSQAQVDPFKAQFELLLHEIMSRSKEG
jgi:hypothetical protein